MKKLLLAVLVFYAPFATSLAAQTSVPIQNPSFEAPVTFTQALGCGQYAPVSPPGWNVQQLPGGGTGLLQLTAATCDPLAPDGSVVALLQQSTISQDLGIALQPVVYTMKFSVASRFYWYPGTYKASILMGSTELCPTSGYAQGDFSEITLTCPVPYYISHYNGFGFPPGNLSISISSTSGWGVLVDKVSLTFTPVS